MRRQRVRKEVGGDGIEAAFWDEDGAGGAGEGVVFGEEGVDPGDFAGGVDVVGSGVGAGGEEGFAVDCVGEGSAGRSGWRGGEGGGKRKVCWGGGEGGVHMKGPMVVMTRRVLRTRAVSWSSLSSQVSMSGGG